MTAFADQTILHAEGEVGNCLQATLASILGWPLESVPHFALLGDVHWWDCMLAWLDSQGFALDYAPIKPQLGEVLPLCCLSGMSPRGFHHAVVGSTTSGEMVHDPHPTRAGLIGVDYTWHLYRKPMAPA